MKDSIIKIGCSYSGAILGVIIMWVWFTYPHSYTWHPEFTMLIWPAVFLSQAGLSSTWLLPAVLLLSLPLGVLATLRKRSRWHNFAATAALLVGYCAVGAKLILSVPTPTPAINPYSQDPALATEFAAAYQEGYINSLSGWLSSYCFRSEAPTRGYYQGQADGHKVFSRVFNLSETRGAGIIRGSAAIDGVRPGSPANTNQLSKPSEPSGPVR